jgi:hypothetical protein
MYEIENGRHAIIDCKVNGKSGGFVKSIFMENNNLNKNSRAKTFQYSCINLKHHRPNNSKRVAPRAALASRSLRC